MHKQRVLLAVHAHPDDEVFGTGGVIAQAHDGGAHTVVVYCTRGEEGEIHDPDLDPQEAKARLGEIREGEVRRAAQILGIDEVVFLPYRDSGMAGTPANEHPGNFHNAQVDEVAARIATIIRRERPEVVLTYDERGVYGHPDHIKANLATERALDLAADPAFREGGEPWRTPRFYHIVVSREDIRRGEAMARERGLSTESAGDEIALESWTRPDEVITTRVDVTPYLDRKREALLAHRTQIPGNDPLFNYPDDILATMFGCETFVRIRPPWKEGEREGSLWGELPG